MLFYISIIILLVIIVVRVNSPLKAFYLIVATKSIIDATWNTRVGPISLISVEGIIMPILYFNLFWNREIPKYWKHTGWLLFISLSTGVIFGLFIKPESVLETIIKNLNILLGFFLIPSLIRSKEDFRRFLIALMIGGIFPIAVSIYQSITGVHWVERYTVGMLRYDGLYHDSFPVRFYGTFTIFAALIYIIYFREQRKLYRFLPMILMIAALFSIYKVFSKAAVVIALAWVVLALLFSRRKLRVFLLIALIGLTFVLIVGDEITDTTEQLFSKEIGYRTGDVKDARFMLSGRGYQWEDYFDFWKNDQKVLYQFLGDGLSRPAHNEYLRILLASGIIGIILYGLFLIRIGFLIIRYPNDMKLFILMLLAMYIVDSIGLAPGDYYYYNILVWGFIGLFLYNDTLLRLDAEPDQEMTHALD